MATKQHLSPWGSDSSQAASRPGANPVDEAASLRQLAQAFGLSVEESRPRVIMQFPAKPEDMLLSGTLANGQGLANRAQVVDAPVGKGHVVMFAIRPFWRWQTQGTFFLGFNTILNWNDLDAGKEALKRPATTGGDNR